LVAAADCLGKGLAGHIKGRRGTVEVSERDSRSRSQL
jgi:hypothetical protein